MGRIQSSIGLITGVPITDTVDQLVALSARPRDLLISRTAALSQQQVALGDLTAQLIGIQFAVNQLAADAPFQQVTVASSDPALLSASVTGNPAVTTSQYTPVRQAQAHQWLSSGLASDNQPIGAGTLRFRFGGFVDAGRDLSELNGGSGVQRGQIRITDRRGASAVIDLRFAQTIDDVLDAINTQTDVNVTAVADGDRLRLIDHTGQSVSNLKVQQVGNGTTAADLGLDAIDLASDEAAGQDVLRLYEGLSLDRLNDRSGVRFGPVDDLQITFRDGSTLSIDLSASGAPETLGQVLQQINAADPARLDAKISASGDALQLTDLTSGSGVFSIASGTGSHAAEDLGIAASVAAGTVTGRRLLSGLKTSLLASLGGGRGLGELGQLVLTDRNGQSDTIDLAGAETLDEVIDRINAAPDAHVTARINDARNGIVLLDESAGKGNLVVADGTDGKQTAGKLRIAVDAAVAFVDSGSLDLQVISENTTLASLKRGRGVSQGSFTITDTSGSVGAVNLAVLQPATIGDVLDAINALGIGVVAEINATGDGIWLRDTSFGSGTLTVQDAGNGTAAADLGVAGTSSAVDLSGTMTEVIDASTTFEVQIDSDDTLLDLITKINALDADVVASAFNAGAGTAPHRLLLASQISGKAGELLIDASAAGLDFQQLAPAQDALLLFGSADARGAGALASSSTNDFDNVLNGVTLSLHATSADPVTITIEGTDSDLVSNVQTFVDQYNRLRDKLDELTFFNASDNSVGILFGSNEALRIETGLARLLTDRFFGVGAIQSLEEIGLSLDDQGQLTFDQQKLQERFASDPEAVRQFFTDPERGVAARFDALIESLAGEQNSLLINRVDALQRSIDANNDRIAFWNERLDNERERLLSEFFRMEAMIGQLQTSLSVLSSLQLVPPLTFTSSDRSI